MNVLDRMDKEVVAGFERPSIRVLIVEDDRDLARLFAILIRAGIPDATVLVDHASTVAEALRVTDGVPHDVYVLDYLLDDGTGVELLRRLRDLGFQSPVILLTGKGDRQTAVEAMKAGASDYLVKGEFSPDLLGPTIRHAVELYQNELARRQAEEQVRVLNAELELRVRERTAELAAANSELESFAYSVSHDLRAPLRGIDGFSRALLDDYSHFLDDEALGYLRRVCAASQRMGELIDDLLALSRVTRREMRRERVDLSEMALEILDDLQGEDPGRVVNLSVAPEIHADGDASLLRIMLVNLLGNAWKFTRRVGAPHIEFTSLECDGETTYCVRDNGAGFQMEYASKLFGPFQRLHSLSEFEGTGIGLATVQRVVRRHGGRVWARAEPGKGAEFFFTLSPSPPSTQPAT